MHYHFNINTFLKAHISLGLTRRYQGSAGDSRMSHSGFGGDSRMPYRAMADYRMQYGVMADYRVQYGAMTHYALKQ